MAHQQDFGEVLHHIQQTRQKVFAQANTALMALYWHVGGIISQKLSAALRVLQPAMVAQYQLQLPDKKLIAAKRHELRAQQKEVGDE